VTEASWTPEDAADRTLEENWLFRLKKEQFRSRASGKTHEFFVLDLADAVNVVALTSKREAILVRQFRAGSREDSLETPGGLVNVGEDPCEAGARELLEETGYAGDPPIVLGTAWANPSLMSQKITTILITGARRVAEPRLDHGEEVTVELVPDIAIPAMIRNGKVDHALAIQGLLLWLVSELPGPLRAVSHSPRPRHTRVLALMGIIIILGLVFGFFANIGSAAVRTLAIVTLCGVGIVSVARIVWGLLIPPREATLEAVARDERARGLARRIMIYGR
jgi:8-oxo-dGTP pyrophosphatase MutT (NUDIX family)